MTSEKSGYSFSYDPNGSLQKIALRRGEVNQRYEFKNELLTGRNNGKGLADSFHYDDEGSLQSVKRKDGEQWEIERQEKGEAKRITYRQNNVVHIDYIFDEKDRLKEMVY